MAIRIVRNRKKQMTHSEQFAEWQDGNIKHPSTLIGNETIVFTEDLTTWQDGNIQNPSTLIDNEAALLSEDIGSWPRINFKPLGRLEIAGIPVETCTIFVSQQIWDLDGTTNSVFSHKWYYSDDPVNHIGTGSYYEVTALDANKDIYVVLTYTDDKGNTNIVNTQPQTIYPSKLAVHLDAANLDSYDGTATNWQDISGEENHFTISGDVSFAQEQDNKYLYYLYHLYM